MHNKYVVKPIGLAHLHRKGAQRQMHYISTQLQTCLDIDLINSNDCDAINTVVMKTNGHNRDIGNAANARRMQR